MIAMVGGRTSDRPTLACLHDPACEVARRDRLEPSSDSFQRTRAGEQAVEGEKVLHHNVYTDKSSHNSTGYANTTLFPSPTI
jgi:hypothetical protein